MGCTNQAGEDNRNVARMASAAGRPARRGARRDGEPALRLGARGGEPGQPGASARRRRPAARGRRRVDDAAHRSRCQSPTARFRAATRPSTTPRSAGDSSNPRMEELYSTESMGETAENVAERYGDRARPPGRVRAREPPAGGRGGGGRVASTRRSCPVPVPAAQGRPGHGPRRRRTAGATRSLDKLARLRPAFREGGTVTAGNSSSLNDGAACVVLASEERASALGRSRSRGSSRSARPASTPPTWASVPCPPRAWRSSARGSRSTTSTSSS